MDTRKFLDVMESLQKLCRDKIHSKDCTLETAIFINKIHEAICESVREEILSETSGNYHA